VTTKLITSVMACDSQIRSRSKYQAVSNNHIHQSRPIFFLVCMLSVIVIVTIVTKVFTMHFLLKDRKCSTVIYIIFSEAPIKLNSFKTAFERCCRRLVEDPNVTNPICWTCKNCSYKCAADCEHCVTQSSTEQF